MKITKLSGLFLILGMLVTVGYSAEVLDQSYWSVTGNPGTDPTSNFLGTTDTEDLVIRTDNTERVRVNSRGRVGIGTDDPRQLLDVEIADHLTDSVSYAERLSHVTSGAPEEGFGVGLEFHIGGVGGSDATLGAIESVLTDATVGAEGGALQFKTTDGGDDSPSTRMTITEDGNVGINIDDPSSRFVIRNDFFGQRPLMSIIAGDETPFHISSAGSVTIDPVGAAVALRVKASSSTPNSNNTPVPFYVTGEEDVNAIYVTKDGDVGIGAAGEGINDKLRIRGPENNGSRASVRIVSGQNQQTMLLDGNEIDGLNAGLFLNNNSDENVVLATGGGNVGIGTASPNHALVIQGDDPIIQIRDDTINNSANAARLELLERAGGAFDGGAYLRWDGQSNRLSVGTINQSVDTDAITVTRSNSRVGIGTTDPQARLHVSGGNGSAKLLIEADVNNSGETNQPKITLAQDGGAVQGEFGYYGATNDLRVVNQFGGAKIIFEADGDVCIGSGC